MDTSKPFTRRAALAAGTPLSELRTRAYRRIFTGVYVDARQTPTPQQHAEAAVLVFPQPAFASHVSAARILGAPIPTFPDEHVTVLKPQDRRTRKGIVCHYAPRAKVRVVDGVQVSDYPQLFAELASMLSLVDLVVVGDHLLRHRRVSKTSLSEFSAAWKGPGRSRLREALGYVRAGVDSPMETRLRMLLVLAGLPEPVVNAEQRNDLGDVIRKHDLSYPSVKVAIEYDGRAHVERVDQWESDIDRREASDSEGWRTVLVTSIGIYSEPHRTVSRVWRVLRERRFPGVPARLSDDWRPHFPGRGR